MTDRFHSGTQTRCKNDIIGSKRYPEYSQLYLIFPMLIIKLFMKPIGFTKPISRHFIYKFLSKIK